MIVARHPKFYLGVPTYLSGLGEVEGKILVNFALASGRHFRSIERYRPTADAERLCPS
jgi:hypothetical protein